MSTRLILRIVSLPLVAALVVLAVGLDTSDAEARRGPPARVERPDARGPKPDVEVEKTAAQVGNLVVGEITIVNSGENDATIDAIDDSLEVHFPVLGWSSLPSLPPGSTPTWYRLADVPVDHPGVVPAGEQLVLPYAFDLCDAGDLTGANAMRNVVNVHVSDADGAKVAHTKSDGFEPVPPECNAVATTLQLRKVDQDGAPIPGVELDVTFPDGVVQTCATDDAGSCLFENLAPGLYTVDEPAPPPDYVFDGCAPDEDPAVAGAQVTLAAGDEALVTCTNIRLVGEGSCEGTRACDGLTGIVGAGSCIGFEACQNASGDIGDGSCTGDLACKEATVSIGDGACRGVQACFNNTGNIGDGSCVGQSACLSNSGDIGSGSCTGTAACTGNSGDVGNVSCNGSFACAGNSATIGDNQCNGDNVCQNNTTPMP